MEVRRPLSDFAFELKCADPNLQHILGMEISDTCDYLEKYVKKRATLFLSYAVKSGKYVTCHVLNGKARFGIYSASEDLLKYSSDGGDMDSPYFAGAMHQLRKQARSFTPILENRGHVKFKPEIVKAWIEHDYEINTGPVIHEQLDRLYAFTIRQLRLERGCIPSNPLTPIPSLKQEAPYSVLYEQERQKTFAQYLARMKSVEKKNWDNGNAVKSTFNHDDNGDR